MTDFFEPGFEYDDATPYSAPELIRTFRCVAVATLPDTDMPLAFGFMRSDSIGWGGTGMDPNNWAKGWNRQGNVAATPDVAAGTPSEVWYWSDDDEGSSPEVYLDVETAKIAAITELLDTDPGGFPEPAFTWRGYTPAGRDTTRWLLDYEGKFTGWSVDRLPVAASVVKAGAR